MASHVQISHSMLILLLIYAAFLRHVLVAKPLTTTSILATRIDETGVIGLVYAIMAHLTHRLSVRSHHLRLLWQCHHVLHLNILLVHHHHLGLLHHLRLKCLGLIRRLLLKLLVWNRSSRLLTTIFRYCLSNNDRLAIHLILFFHFVKSKITFIFFF